MDNSLILPSLKQVSFLKTGGHPISRHNTPSRTLKIREIMKYDSVCSIRDVHMASIQMPRRADLSLTKQSIKNVSLFPNFFDNKLMSE